MGASSSKNPDWYPGHPIGDFYGECTCGQSRPSLEGRAMREKKVERKITSLPVVELMDMNFVANGGYCSVFLCKYRGHSVVAKRVREDLPLPARREALDNLWTEFECLRSLSHPNVINVYGLCRVKRREGYDDWNEGDVCLLLEELAAGTVGHLFGTIHTVEKNLANAIAKSRLMKLMPFRSRLNRSLEIVLALEYLHGGSQMGVMMHRDIKNVNVGFAKNGNLKLMDFGLAKIMPIAATESEETYQITGEVGSFRYMAPEVVRHQPYNAKADIYSWAILTWEMMSIEKPYAWATKESSFIKRVVMRGERPVLDKNWPDGLSKLLANAWHSDYKKRPTASQLVVALREIRAQLPAPRGSFRKRPSATTNVSRRRHSWTGGTSMSSLPRGAVEQRPGSTVQGSNFENVSGGGHDDTSARPTKATEEAREMATAAAAAGGEKPESNPSARKPQQSFAMLPRASLPTLNTSSSSSSSRRSSWYKLAKKSLSTPATFAKEDYNRNSNPRPTESGDVVKVAAIPSLSTAVDSILKTDARGNDGGRHAPEALGVVVAGSTRVTGRCAFHQGLVDEREAIVNTLASEAKAQMASPLGGRASSATSEFVAPSQKALEATNFMRGRESTTSDVPGDISNPRGISIGIDASGTVEDVSGRSSRRSNSVIKLFPSASPHPAEEPDATPISKGGCCESIGATNGATNGVVGTVALTVSG